MTTQALLPFPHLQIWQKHLEWFNAANAGSYDQKKTWFYPFKSRFLRNHAVSDGFDLQTIVKKCWCGNGIWVCEHTGRRERCDKCNGTGIYSRRKVILGRWLLCGQIFHEPLGAPEQFYPRISPVERIDGYIVHAPVDSRRAQRCMERLFLRYEPTTWLKLWNERWVGWRNCATRRISYRINAQIRRVNRALRIRETVEDIPF